MGEYRIPVGLEYKSPICKLFDEKLILDPAIRAIGFTPENCPPTTVSFIIIFSNQEFI